jgi:hypothetical protein
MPLTRGEITGHDIERMAFKFTMLNGEEVVKCQISDAALDDLAGMKGTESFARQAQFLSLRDTVEGIASELFAKRLGPEGSVVRIFSKHVLDRVNTERLPFDDAKSIR